MYFGRLDSLQEFDCNFSSTPPSHENRHAAKFGRISKKRFQNLRDEMKMDQMNGDWISIWKKDWLCYSKLALKLIVRN